MSMIYDRPIALALLIFSLFCVGYVACKNESFDVSIQSVETLRSASGALTAGETSTVVASRGSAATIYLSVTTLTLADADDEVDFYVQTSYDGGTNWVDCQNIHYNNDDNGTTATVTAVIDGTVDGPGLDRFITGTNRAAGADPTETVPANAIWDLINFQAFLTADANASNRNVRLSIGDGSSDFIYAGNVATITANQARYVNFGPYGDTQNAVGSTHYNGIPPIRVTSGTVIAFDTSGLLAGDDWDAPLLAVEEWHDSNIATDGTLRDDIRAYNRPLGTNVRIKTTVTGATAPTYAYSATAHFR